MKKNIRITAAQINTVVGDIYGNTEKIIKNALVARDQQEADVVVFPEMALTGYPPEDLLLRQDLYDQTKIALKQIQNKVKNIYIILGLPTKEKQYRFNTAVIIYDGKILSRYHKQQLPNYGVFDEKRYFTAGTKTCVINIKGIKTAITICEDLWHKESALAAKKMGAQLIISINASPFDIQKPLLREQILSRRARENNLPIIYVNSVGGQDELVFDGGSLVVNSKGKVTQRAPFFVENLMLIEIKGSRIKGSSLILEQVKITCSKMRLDPLDPLELVYKALVLGVKDYIEKNNFKGAIVGTSGGIDSALTLAIAVDALGKNRVEAIYLPSRYSSKLSEKITKEQAKILGIKYNKISIEPIFKEFLSSLPKEWPKTLGNSTKENLQARCRGTMLMAFSNKKGLIVLSTGNKSEMAVGYATLYGDMVGGFCVLKDVPKMLVYQLAEYRNKISKVIPQAAITRAPTAELAKNQKDVDDLPPYPILDEILKRYIELNQSIKKIIAAGFNKTLVTKIINMVNNNEYKRRQAAPGIKITTNAFGRERRYPITSRFDKK
ncbi:MAG: NAD+ synthase [Gammaproteobacteria bacterium RBG_16_37_9]|nr:MAG: NAD+ synthase [Gammaproteobacteria bacterium RBG_16_37_9]